jgi:hypothetical protein
MIIAVRRGLPRFVWRQQIAVRARNHGGLPDAAVRVL